MHFSLVSRLIFSYCCFCKKVNCVFSLLLHFQGRCSFHAQADNEVQITQSDILRNVFFQVLTFKSLKVSFKKIKINVGEKEGLIFCILHSKYGKRGESRKSIYPG